MPPKALPMAADTVDKTAIPEKARVATPPGNVEGTRTMRTRHAVLKQLEALARVELQDMHSVRRGNAAPVVDNSLVWLGLAWDMGLSGCSIVEVAPPRPLAEPAAAWAASAATTDPASGTDEVALPDPC